MSSGKKCVTTYPPNSAALKMDGDVACTDAQRVGGHAVSAEGCKQLQVELIAEQILAAVAETRMRCRAPKEEGFCGRGIRAESAGSKKSASGSKENHASSREHGACSGDTQCMWTCCVNRAQVFFLCSSQWCGRVNQRSSTRRVWRNLRKNTCAAHTVPYLNRNGSPGREPTVYGVTYVREFGKLDL